MGQVLRFPLRYSDRLRTRTRRVSWGFLKEKIEAAKLDLSQSGGGQRADEKDYWEPASHVLSGTYTGTEYYVNCDSQGFTFSSVSVGLLSGVMQTPPDIQGVAGPKVGEVIVLPMPRKQAPLRLIVRRFPRDLHIEEELECGHWHTNWGPKTNSKRRRCHECLRPRPPKKPVAWSVESGTAGQFQWSIQRKA